jgi:hypothetical protein
LCDLETSKKEEAMALFGPQHHKKTVNTENSNKLLNIYTLYSITGFPPFV